MFPYTNYKVTVLENIKGSLKQDTQVPITKFGGVNKDKTAIVLNEEDYLPQQGDICMFAIRVREDGVLVSNAKNTSNLITRDTANTYSNEDIETYKDSEVYQTYVNGANEEEDVWGEHSISKEYDAGYE